MFGFWTKGIYLIVVGVALAASATPRDNEEDIRYMGESYKNSLRKFPTLLSCYSRYAARNGEEAAYNILCEIIQKHPGCYYITIDSGLAVYNQDWDLRSFAHGSHSLTRFLEQMLRAMPVDSLRSEAPIQGVRTIGRLYSLLQYKMALYVQCQHAACDGVTYLFLQFCKNNAPDLAEYLYQPNKLVPIPEIAQRVLGGDKDIVPSIAQSLVSFRNYIEGNRPTYKVQLDAISCVKELLGEVYCSSTELSAQAAGNFVER